MKSQSEPLTRGEFIDLFWQSGTAQVLADRTSYARFAFVRSLPVITIHPVSPGDPLDVQPEFVDFYLEGQTYGHELFVAVMGKYGRHPVAVVVPPFHVTYRSNLPTMRPSKEAPFADAAPTYAAPSA